MNYFLHSLILFFLVLYFSPSTAQYAIGVRDTTLVDISRSSRNIQTYFYYPAVSAGTGVALALPPAGGFPVVVVAHGFSMDYAAFTNFKDSLVPKGYIVIIPNTETGIVGVSHGNFGGDLSFLVNYMQQQNTVSSSRYFSKVKNKSAIIGHSMGGGATYLGANGNANVTTTVTFSAAETSPSAVTACASITVPSLVFAGQNDCVAPQATNQTLMYNALASTCKTKIVINNGGHCQYCNSSFTCDFGEGTCRGTSTILTRAQQQPIVFDYLYKWLDFYLKGNCTAYTSFQNLLSSDSRVTFSQSCSYNLPTATIFNIGSTLKCKEDSIRLYVGARFTSYLWSNAAIDSSIRTSIAGSYFVVVTDNYGCTDTSNTIVVSNRIPARASITPSGSLNTCGASTTVAISATGIGLSSYRWNIGDTGSSYTTSAIGNYYVSTIDANGCKASSDTLKLSSTTPIIPVISPSDSILFCPDDSVAFTVTPAFYSYTWTDATSNASYTAYESEIVYLSTVDSNGCSGYSDTAWLTKLPPPMPTIINWIDSLETDTGFVSYTWYNSANTVVGSNRVFFPGATVDTYRVSVTDANGCRGVSAAMAYSGSVGINEGTAIEAIEIYPIPFLHELTIQNIPENSNIEIAEMSGRIVLSIHNTLSRSLSIPTDEFAHGFYLCRVFSDKSSTVYKVVK